MTQPDRPIFEPSWPVRGGARGRSLEERLWEKVDKSGACWEWRGAITSRGYPVIQVERRAVYVHRLILSMQIGRPLLPTEFACHTCDNPACVRPGHLYLGDATSNNRDTVRRGRHVAWNRKAVN